ncbi:hypothetical protein GCM10007304_34370 [Rhodococcoides trifolii]|uniref:Uncharacterized protein n=1 Tax=Rhodococcoides trifolii TaxID=908250 RepID=A0A917G0Z2_9NOCA|nr:hypothetical protein GCM10007304_34370 [Rhodococcus trifolii]
MTISLALLLGLSAGTATAAPQTSILQVPVVTGFEVGPWSVPGDPIQTTPIRATVGETPGSVRFAAVDVKPYYYEYNSRWLTVQWRNLSTGAAGAVDLRKNDVVDVPNIGYVYARELPLEVVANTGPGQVAVMVTQNRSSQVPIILTLFPGLGLLSVP